MDNTDITEMILEEIFKDLDKMLWNLALTTKIPGYDPDDLMQEMRIKIWKTIKHNNYDPERVKPTSFYYRVCKRHLINLNASKIYRYKNSQPQKREYRDMLDQKNNVSDDILPEIGDFQLNFVRNFSEEFIQLVLPSEEINEKK